MDYLVHFPLKTAQNKLREREREREQISSTASFNMYSKTSGDANSSRGSYPFTTMYCRLTTPQVLVSSSVCWRCPRTKHDLRHVWQCCDSLVTAADIRDPMQRLAVEQSTPPPRRKDYQINSSNIFLVIADFRLQIFPVIAPN